MAGRAETSRANGKKGGRPKGSKSTGTLAKEAARERLRALVMAELDPLVAAQIAQAKGLSYLVVRDKHTGKFLRVSEGMARSKEKLKPNEETIEVWEKDPSVAAFSDLMNRALDKPTEQLEVNLHAEWDKLIARITSARTRK